MIADAINMHSVEYEMKFEFVIFKVIECMEYILFDQIIILKQPIGFIETLPNWVLNLAAFVENL